MNYKKLFFPIGGGEELEERLYGAFLIADKFNTKLEVLKCMKETNSNIYKSYAIPQNIVREIDKIIVAEYEDENKDFTAIFKKVINESNIDNALVNLKIKRGLRSFLVEEESKFCDLVIASAPPLGISTATFETSVLKSGKPVLMFPRIMKTFSMNSVIIGWNNSIEASRALSSSIEILKQAQKVHIVSSLEYVKEPQIMQNLVDYLLEHEIDVSYEIVKTTRIPGQALLNAALDGNFDLIVAGAYGHKGLKELMFGGATRYLLENSSLPVFMSH